MMSQEGQLREAVIPVSSKMSQLTISVLHKFFKVMPPGQQHVVAAVADSDGSVSLIRLYNRIQPPFEAAAIADLNADKVAAAPGVQLQSDDDD